MPWWRSDSFLTGLVLVVAVLLTMGVLVLGYVAVVQAIGVDELVETNAFRSKMAIFLGLLAAGGAIAGLRCRRERMDYFLAAEIYEDHVLLAADDEKLQGVRQASWSHRAGRSSTYSSISLGLILVVALLFVANEDDVEQTGVEALFIFVILIASVSVIFYGVSLQLWDEALGEGYELPQVLELRRRALVLSSLGWITLVSALGLAVITVHSPLGTVVGVAGVLAGLYLFEHKWRLAHLRLNSRLPGGPWPYLRRVVSGRPKMGAQARQQLARHG